jgi:hypothetical protein
VATSQNGYPVGRAHCAIYTVPGTRVQLALRKGSVAEVLLHLASRFDDEVEDIDTHRSYSEDPRPDIPGGGPSAVGDDWSYASRPVRGGEAVSNHASGTAIDMNATQHPLGKRGTFTGEQVKRIRGILADLVDPATKRCVVRWGGDYVSRADEMHWEVVADEAAVRRVAAKIREGKMAATTADVKKFWTGVKVIQNENEPGGADPEPDWTPAQAMAKADTKLDNLKTQAKDDRAAVLAAVAELAAQVKQLTAQVAALRG